MSRILLMQQIDEMKDSLERDYLIRLTKMYPAVDGWVINFTIEPDEGPWWVILVHAQREDEIKTVEVAHNKVRLITNHLIKTGTARVAFQEYVSKMHCEIERMRSSLFGPDRPHYLDVSFPIDSRMETLIKSTLNIVPSDGAFCNDGTRRLQFGYSSYEEADNARRMLKSFKVIAEVHDLTDIGS